jgi:ElaB/YqjD/DUF883 family membrane-anchored ribosome-binding protein
VNVATLLKDSANAYMAATLAKRVAGDVVRRVPYPMLGAAALLGAVAGALWSRRHRSRRPSD